MAIRIVIDSSADYSRQEIQTRNIICIPMSVTIDNVQYLDGVDLSKEKFYELLKETNDFPKTSQPSTQGFIDCFEEAKEAGDSVIAILVSSALSGTYQNAHLAKSMVEYDDIHIIDSRHVTLCVRILADRAAKMRDAGCSVEEIVEEIESLKKRVRVYAALDTLEYLAKGGRLNKSVAAIGELAKVKPLVAVNEEGEVVQAGKQLGMKGAIRAVTKHLLSENLDETAPIYYIYADDSKNCKAFLHSLEKKGFPIGDPKLRGIGPTIGTHIGPDAFGVVYVVKHGWEA